MPLPTVTKSSLNVRPIERGGLPARYMNPGELEVLIALVASARPAHVIEFGVNVGRTAKAILSNVVSVEQYTGIDVPETYVPSKAVQRYEVPTNPGALVVYDPRFTLLIRPRGSLDLSADDLEPCDAAFIDGDHGAEAVAHDTMLARALTRPGGIIVWHDYHDLGTVDVKAVLDRMHEAGRDISLVAGTWLAFERV